MIQSSAKTPFVPFVPPGQALPAVGDRPDELADTEGEQREVELPAPEYDEPDDEPRGGAHQRRECEPDQRVLEERDLFRSRDATR